MSAVLLEAPPPWRRQPASSQRPQRPLLLMSLAVLGHLSLQSPTVATVTSTATGSCEKSPSVRAERRSLSLRKSPEQRDKRREALREQAQQGENCQVQ
ncbi:hypothetical protein N1851_006358 [Merluccius polli]|uniref:Uncharacterized protein n=1 Tax=Merluccius polli TaxID=89951 RepID=A0AA47N4G1_MERPO|nr:hypothetical protein N1851_006358 [Merluccius polli]